MLDIAGHSFGHPNGHFTYSPHKEAASPLRTATAIRKLSLYVACLSLAVVLVDYLFDIGVNTLAVQSQNVRTNPLTFCALALAIWATVLQRPGRLALSEERMLWLAVIGLSLLAPWSASLSQRVFPDVFFGTMGLNTAASLACLALSQLLKGRRQEMAIGFALAAGVFPCISVYGYLLGFADFAGDMAPTTVAALLPLCAANLVRFVRHRMLRLVLRDNVAGRLLRFQIKIWATMSIVFSLLINIELSHFEWVYPILHTMEMLFVLVLITYFGNRFAGMIERSARIERALEIDAQSDALTGAATRKAAVDYFSRLDGRKPLGLILLDIDHFKSVNDTYGHEVGDDVIRALTATVRQNLRLTDLLVRWGGEEFLILVRVPDVATLMERAEQLRVAIAQMRENHGLPLDITASFGVLLIDPTTDPDLRGCVASTDAALYAAKKAGRNRVILAEHDSHGFRRFGKALPQNDTAVA